MLFELGVNAVLSILGGLVTYRMLPKVKEMFIKANLFGIDLSKRHREKMYLLFVALVKIV